MHRTRELCKYQFNWGVLWKRQLFVLNADGMDLLHNGAIIVYGANDVLGVTVQEKLKYQLQMETLFVPCLTKKFRTSFLNLSVTIVLQHFIVNNAIQMTIAVRVKSWSGFKISKLLDGVIKWKGEIARIVGPYMK